METNVGAPTFRLEVFEGPLDLLLHLISKNKVDVYDIPVAEILEQYLAYMEAAKQFNIELTSEFSVMAAQLLLIKSSMILPKYEDMEEDPRKELVQSLIEYQLFKTMRPYFQERAEEYDGSFTKLPEPPIPIPVSQYGLNVDLLAGALRAMQERKDEIEAEPEFHLGTVLTKETVSLDEKMGTILTMFRHKKSVSLRGLYRQAKTKRELIVTFLAILELCKDQHLLLRAEEDDFTLEVNEEALSAKNKEEGAQ